MRGWTLPELVLAMALVGIATTLLLPQAASVRSAAMTAAGARHLATTLQAVRWRSVATGRGQGLLFRRDARGWKWFTVEDGNGNGLRTAEIRGGQDRTVSGPHRLEDAVPGITLGFPGPSPIPRIPPAHGTIDRSRGPVRVGSSDLLAFGPLGSASGGTLYVTDRARRLYAIVLYGRTSRITIWRYESSRGRWHS